MSKHPYIILASHQDNVLETISAEHINLVHDAIYTLQSEMLRQADEDFMNQAMFDLKHNTVNNSMVVEDFATEAKIDVASLSNAIYIPEIASVILETAKDANGNQIPAIFQTKAFVNATANPYRKLRLLVNEYKPVGCTIVYEVSFDGISFYRIYPGNPIPLDANGDEQSQVILRTTMTAQGTEINELPRLDGFALLYTDDKYVFRYLDDGITIDIESGWDGTIVE